MKMAMKLKFFVLSLLFTLVSCDKQKSRTPVKVTGFVEEPAPITSERIARSSSTLMDSCQQHWRWQHPHDSLKRSYLNEIVSDSSNHLTERNRAFLLALAEECRQFRNRKLVVEKILFPVFRLSEDEIGVLSSETTFKAQQTGL